MSVPAHVADRVNEALGALYRHPHQTLLAWYRYAIYEALVADRSPASYAIRARIDMLSVQHVLFCWQPYAQIGWHAPWPQPADLLSLAGQTLQGHADRGEVRRLLTRAEALADVAGEPATSAQYPAWCVFEAALRALQSAWVYGTLCGSPAAPDKWPAAMIQLDDASRYAAIAIAGDLAHTEGNRRARATRADRGAAGATAAAQLRQTFFWEWWLREAIPQAWRLG